MPDKPAASKDERQAKADRVAQKAVQRLREKGFSDKHIQEAIDGNRKLGDG